MGLLDRLTAARPAPLESVGTVLFTAQLPPRPAPALTAPVPGAPAPAVPTPPPPPAAAPFAAPPTVDGTGHALDDDLADQLTAAMDDAVTGPVAAGDAPPPPPAEGTALVGDDDHLGGLADLLGEFEGLGTQAPPRD